MKIDIEGLEIKALKGAIKLLEKTPPKIIVMELSQRPGVLAQPTEIIDFLRVYKYTPYLIRDKKLVQISEENPLASDLDPNVFFMHESFINWKV